MGKGLWNFFNWQSLQHRGDEIKTKKNLGMIKMPHSYIFLNPIDFEVVSCPQPYTIKGFSRDNRRLADECVEWITRNFQDYTLFYSLGCYMQWVFFTFAPNNEDVPIFTNDYRWLFTNRDRDRLLSVGNKNVSADLMLVSFLGFPVVLKSAKNVGTFTDILHEYVIGTYALNRLRLLLPNYMYTYAMYNDPRKGNVIALEWMQGRNLEIYVKTLINEEFSQEKMMTFLQIFIQIVLALEIGQEVCLFTHFDLHARNIMCREVQRIPRLDFAVLDTIYSLTNVKMVSTLIDFGHSTAYCKDVKKIINGKVRRVSGQLGKAFAGSFPIESMFPFYIPGADLYRLLFYLWSNLYSERDKDDKKKLVRRESRERTMGSNIQIFIEYILKEIYGIDVRMIRTMEDYHALSKWKGTNTPNIYFSPLRLLSFIHDDRIKPILLKILSLPYYPWDVYDRRNGVTLPETPQIKRQRLEECFKQRYCSNFLLNIAHDLAYVYNMTWDESALPTTYKTLEYFVKTYADEGSLPPLMIEYLPDIIKKVSDQRWPPFIKMMNIIMTKIRQEQAQIIPLHTYHYYQANRDKLHYLYRIFQCWMGYISYLNRFFRFPLPNKKKTHAND